MIACVCVRANEKRCQKQKPKEKHKITKRNKKQKPNEKLKTAYWQFDALSQNKEQIFSVAFILNTFRKFLTAHWNKNNNSNKITHYPRYIPTRTPKNENETKRNWNSNWNWNLEIKIKKFTKKKTLKIGQYSLQLTCTLISYLFDYYNIYTNYPSLP